MKILFITRRYPPSVGGMQLFAYDLSRALADRADLKLVKWGGSNRWLPVVIPYLFLAAFWRLLRGGIDVVHAQDGIMSVPAYVLAKLFRKPLAVVLHGKDITYKNPLYAPIPWAVRRADIVICISQAAADAAMARGIPESKLKVIPLAVDDKLFAKSGRENLVKTLNLSDDSQILLTVGRLVKRKGAAWFIDSVLPDLVKKHPQLLYLVVGEGQERSAIEAAVKRRSLNQHVKLTGRADDALYESAYNGADIFVMPNINVPEDMEGFGLVLLEASLCELPVVAAETEGIKDAVTPGQNAVLVPVEDGAAFQREISRFLDDKAYAAKFGQHSRQFTLENYQWDKLAARYLAEYERLHSRR